MKAKVLSTICLVWAAFNFLGAQIPVQDTIPVDSTSFPLDSIFAEVERGRDSTAISSPVTISPNAPEEDINYIAKDSMIYDIENQKVYLYGQAEVTYTTIKLRADYIEYDWNNNTVHAKGAPDSLGRISGNPHFSDGEQQFTSSEMRYNFQSGKGIVYDAATTQNELYVLGEKAKYIKSADTTHTDVIYSERAIFTTCDHPIPHFGVRSTKQKVIPNEVAVVGPSNLEIMGVPTPIWLPFGFFPLSQTRSTGLIFPRGYEYNAQTGFGFRNVGWYFPIGEQMDMQLTGDVYVKGSFRVRSVINYARRYKYRGSFQFEYGYNRTENEFGTLDPSSTFLFILNHNQDAKAHPSRTIGGRINIQTNDAIRQNYNDATSQLNTSLSSGFTYRESYPGRPFNLSAGLTHSQNTTSRSVTINFPDFVFQTQTLYPFRGKTGGGANPKWYEKVTLNYKGEAKATLTATDTTLFTRETLENIKYGSRHTVSTGTNIKLLKYFNLNPSVNYNEIWYFQRTQKTFDPTTIFVEEELLDDLGEPYIAVTDTIFGQINEEVVNAFTPLRTFNMGANLGYEDLWNGSV